MPQCPSTPVSQCPSAPVPRRTCVPVTQFPCAPVPQRPCVPVSHCIFICSACALRAYQLSGSIKGSAEHWHIIGCRCRGRQNVASERNANQRWTCSRRCSSCLNTCTHPVPHSQRRGDATRHCVSRRAPPSASMMYSRPPYCEVQDCKREVVRAAADAFSVDQHCTQ